MDTKGFGHLTSNDTYFDDIWFISVNMAKDAMSVGVDYCGPAKIIQKGFCRATLENFMKDCP